MDNKGLDNVLSILHNRRNDLHNLRDNFEKLKELSRRNVCCGVDFHKTGVVSVSIKDSKASKECLILMISVIKSRIIALQKEIEKIMGDYVASKGFFAEVYDKEIVIDE
jgi:hypothetical protein